MKAKKIQTGGKLLAAIGLLFVLNWLSRAWFGYPFLYCWGRPLGEIYTAWAVFINLLLLVWFGWCVIRTQYQHALMAAAILVFVNFVPQLISKFIGGSCG